MRETISFPFFQLQNENIMESAVCARDACPCENIVMFFVGFSLSLKLCVRTLAVFQHILL